MMYACHYEINDFFHRDNIKWMNENDFQHILLGEPCERAAYTK